MIFRIFAISTLLFTLIHSICSPAFATDPITILRLIAGLDKTDTFDLSGDGVVDDIDFFLLSLGWAPTEPGEIPNAP